MTIQSASRPLLERNTLRFLCSVLIKGGTRGEICRLLDPGVFQDPLRRVVFEEIRELGSIDSRRLRELLPARVTNRGFPDFDLKSFLAPQEVSEKEIDELFESQQKSIGIHAESFGHAVDSDETVYAGPEPLS